MNSVWCVFTMEGHLVHIFKTEEEAKKYGLAFNKNHPFNDGVYFMEWEITVL